MDGGIVLSNVVGTCVQQYDIWRIAGQPARQLSRQLISTPPRMPFVVLIEIQSKVGWPCRIACVIVPLRADQIERVVGIHQFLPKAIAIPVIPASALSDGITNGQDSVLIQIQLVEHNCGGDSEAGIARVVRCYCKPAYGIARVADQLLVVRPSVRSVGIGRQELVNGKCQLPIVIYVAIKIDLGDSTIRVCHIRLQVNRISAENNTEDGAEFRKDRSGRKYAPKLKWL